MVDKEQIKGAADKAKGVIKEGVGKIIGSDKLVAEGVADKAEGSAREAVGDVKDAAKKAVDSAKR
jgi:uncharacterized protein YjbJ (UPF0337 family)